jgi:DNA polymerase-3 subunit delta
MDALAFLEKADKAKMQPVYVLFGDEDFLKREVRAALVRQLLGDADPAYALTSYPGPDAVFSVVKAELDTLPFLSPVRVVVIEQADPFVTKYRPQLEKYLTAPSKGVLILDVKSWPSNTKLAKALPNDASLACKGLAPARAPSWCAQHAEARYGKKLTNSAAALLLDYVGPEMGLLDQELAKLAAYVGDAKSISDEDVDVLVGRSRSAETFKIFDAIGNGRPAEALAILHKLFEQADQSEQGLAIQILGAFSWQLRRLAQAARLAKQGVPVYQALTEVGFQEFRARNAEQQLRHLGIRRLERLFDWLLETDLGLKGNSSLAPKMQVERLVVRLAQPREAVTS